MKVFLRTVQWELTKVLTSKVGYITIVLVLFVQPFFAMVAAKSYLEIGLDATPETNAYLIEAIPPIEYIGFDIVLIGLLPMVVFGALLGASEFNNHTLRTTLLCQNNRNIVFCAKLSSVALIALVISIITNYLTIAGTHRSLGEQGLNPFFLSGITWKYLTYSVIYWVFLTLISFGIGFLFRSALIPLFFLVPQIYNLGSYLAQKWKWGRYLPVAAGDLMIATPTSALPHKPIMGAAVLLLWMGIVLLVAWYFFIDKDVGGEY